MRGRLALLVCISPLLLLPTPAAAQGVRPGDERPELEELLPEQTEEPLLPLPPIPLPPTGRRDRLSSMPRVFVKSFRVVGSSVFSEEELTQVTAPYANREISQEELIGARDAVTRHYIEHGYITSGAVIPDQTVAEDVIELDVIEGRLGEVAVAGTEYFRAEYIRGRLQLGAQRPVNVHTLEQTLQRLQQDHRIRTIQAELSAGLAAGESLLSVEVEEEHPYGLRLSGGNGESPTIGSWGGTVFVEHANLNGIGDVLSGYHQKTQGLTEWEGRYALPISARDTMLELSYRYSDGEVVEKPFSRIDVESETVTYAVAVSHPVYRTPRSTLRIGVSGELRRNETTVLGEPVAFLPGQRDPQTRLSVLRLFQEWTHRGRNQVIAARSTVNLGLDVFDASDVEIRAPGDLPDGTFTSWLGQVQWLTRLPERYGGSQLILRTDLQLARDTLFPMEKFSVGGSHTVRGYRENELVRDNGLVASAEIRIPILRAALGRDLFQIAPFVDFGRAWDEFKTPSPKTLSSVGIGLRWMPREQWLLSAYWGGRLRKVHRRGNDIQNNGFHIQVSLAAF